MKENQVLLIGYVGKELVTQLAKTGMKRVILRVATHDKTKNSSGEPSYHTVWHDIVAWDHTAKYAEQNFVKGSRILVEGSIEYLRYPDKQGHMRYYTRIVADSLLNLDR